MKRTTTFAAILCLLTTFAFGQRPEHRKTDRFEMPELEKQLKALGLDDNNKPDSLSFKNKSFSYKPSLKSFEAVKQNPDNFIEYSWDETTSQWTLNWKEEYASYDVNGNLTQYFNYYWDDTSSKWVNRFKGEYTYDANGNRTQMILYIWDESNSQWVSFFKGVYTYNTNGIIMHRITYTWDKFDSQWLIYSKEEYTCDANGNTTQIIGHDWDIATSQWVVESKEEYSCDANGNTTQIITFGWDKTSNQWVESSKHEYTYNASENQTKYICYIWSKTTSQWVEPWSIEYTYDASGNLTQEIRYNGNQYNEDFTSKKIYNYSVINTSLPNNSQTPIINLYPNPVTDYLTINCDNYSQVTFELFDLQGSKLMSQVVNNSETINMSELNSGIYVYQLFMDNKKQSGKIVKQ